MWLNEMTFFCKHDLFSKDCKQQYCHKLLSYFIHTGIHIYIHSHRYTWCMEKNISNNSKYNIKPQKKILNKMNGFSKNMKWNECLLGHLCVHVYRLNLARRTSWGWRDEWDDTALQTQNSKFERKRGLTSNAWHNRLRSKPTMLSV